MAEATSPSIRNLLFPRQPSLYIGRAKAAVEELCDDLRPRPVVQDGCYEENQVRVADLGHGI